MVQADEGWKLDLSQGPRATFYFRRAVSSFDPEKTQSGLKLPKEPDPV
jgi:hypothetical protein